MNVSINEAVRHLGISVNTVCKRIRDGELQAKKELRPQGFAWKIAIKGKATADLPGHSHRSPALHRLSAGPAHAVSGYNTESGCSHLYRHRLSPMWVTRG